MLKEEKIEKAYQDLKLVYREIKNIDELEKSRNDVSEAYRSLINKWHPDHKGYSSIAQRINNAKKTLEDYFANLAKKFSTQENSEPTRGILVEPPFKPALAKPWQPEEFSENVKDKKEEPPSDPNFRPGIF
jgi:hypothetical protein